MWTVELKDERTCLTVENLADVKAWRAQHPQATLYEIEVEVDAQSVPALPHRVFPLDEALGLPPGQLTP